MFTPFFRGFSFKCAPITAALRNTCRLLHFEYSICQPNTTLLRRCGRNMPPSFTSFIPTHSSTPFPCDPQFRTKSSHTEITSQDIHFSCFDEFEFDFEDDPELVRRRKIGMANKGKVPWNKGRKHSAGTKFYEFLLHVII